MNRKITRLALWGIRVGKGASELVPLVAESWLCIDARAREPMPQAEVLRCSRRVFIYYFKYLKSTHA